ncbi:hypothetical protein JQX08_14480 [Pseudomonas sp. UL073]|uniref:Uncharacterized protein n=1 Tax=Zestomonas insulae TaxID=2809017 RepID=A0ABS2IFQ5_9GAMM|nr:hypothetical protein [Pseudomonas insulae]MBM7061914.1 hypothetical protein [Pseudomonas insulae]
MTIGSFILLIFSGWLLLCAATLWAMLRLARHHYIPVTTAVRVTQRPSRPHANKRTIAA